MTAQASALSSIPWGGCFNEVATGLYCAFENGAGVYLNKWGGITLSKDSVGTQTMFSVYI